MNMGAAAPAFKQAGNEYFVSFKDNAADRAYPVPITPYAIEAAPYMHEPVFTAVQGRESDGADEFTIVKFGGAYGAGLGITGHAYAPGFTSSSSKSYVSPGRDTYTYEKGITEPEQDDPDYNKN